jgi:PAS domain S-box-containing protein
VKVRREKPATSAAKLRTPREDLAVQLAQYTEAFELAPFGYVRLDAQGRVIQINRCGSEILRCERPTVAGTPFAAFVASEAVPRFRALIAEATRARGPVRGELELVRRDARVEIRVAIAALPRTPTTLLVAFEDISGSKAEELALSHASQVLARINERKDEFIAMLSHALRSPLSAVRTSVAALELAPPGSAAGRDAIEILGRSTDELTRIVDDLREVSPRVLRILVIEDKRDTAVALAAALRLKGHFVELAHNGVGGLALAERSRPEVILCDVGLPDIDGYAVARRLRASACEAYLVALSGYAREDDVARALDAGFSCHVAKPPELDALERVLLQATFSRQSAGAQPR